MKASFAHPFVKLVLVGVIWGLPASLLRRNPVSAARHPSRHRARARPRSSAVVLVLSLGMTLILGARLW
jgi:hypothetical protein